MTDTASREASSADSGDSLEKNYGLIPDRLAWDTDLGGDVSEVLGCQVFSGVRAAEAKRVEALVRTPEVGVYRTHYRAGAGENGLHSHPGDSVWLVLEGSVRFYGLNSALIADVGQGGGVMIPSGMSYRFQCTVESELVRFSGPPPAARGDA